MDFNFKGLPQLLQKFPNDEEARKYYEQIRWNGTPVCPFCGCDKWYKLKDYRYYKCGNKACHKKYTVTVGTFFEGSHIALNIWFAAMYLASSHKKGISSHQLAKDLNITQKSAWFMLHRIREMVSEKKPVKLSGIIEADETYMSRKFHSENKPTGFDYTLSYPHIKDKGCVFGMIERGGRVVVKVFEAKDTSQIKAAIHNNVKKHSWLFTDSANLYKTGLDNFKRGAVVHSKREYVKGDIHTNNIENFWGIMKRGIYGIYHQVSYKHLQRYCHEYSFRFNNRKIPDNERFSISLSNTAGRLTYSKLIANEPRKKETYTQEKNEWD